MPVLLPDNLPAAEKLADENIFVMDRARGSTQDIRPLRIVVLNLMPTKITTETQIARLLGNSPLQVDLHFLQTASYCPTHVAPEHLQSFYTTFECIENERFDGLIVTGAPVETMEFETVAYWDELRRILDWSTKHVYSTLCICWGAMAALNYFYGIKKIPLAEKLSGVYPHRVTRPGNPLVRGFDDVFVMPHSRHTALCLEDLQQTSALRVLAEGDASGPAILSTENGRRIFVTGHPEYDRLTLDAEYRRDVGKGMSVPVPYGYYPNDDPTQTPIFSWRSHAHLLYQNWLNYYVYQSTPYDLKALPPVEN